jgi:anti-sigma factor (TIGR02949 family)
MTDKHDEKNPVCRKFGRDLYHFQAGELPQGEQQALARHVDACPGCARLLEVEDSLLGGLKRRLVRTEAPPGLRVRIGEALEAGAARRGLAAWLRIPWLVPAAAALLLALVIVPAMPTWGVARVDGEAVVVDLDCELAGYTLKQQRQCTHPRHLNALKLDGGTYWNISIDDDLGRGLVVDREMRGHRLHVVGDLYTGIRTLHLTDVHDLDPALAARLVTPPAPASRTSAGS